MSASPLRFPVMNATSVYSPWALSFQPQLGPEAPATSLFVSGDPGPGRPRVASCAEVSAAHGLARNAVASSGFTTLGAPYRSAVLDGGVWAMASPGCLVEQQAATSANVTRMSEFRTA